MIITVPLGVLGGVYMAEYAKQGKITSFIRSCIELLASLPSIVVGMFGLLIFVNSMGWGYSIIGGALALTIFNIPVMVDRKSTRLNSSHVAISYAVFCLKKKTE